MAKTLADTSGITRRSMLLTLVPMSEQQRGRRAIEVGPTGQIVAANIVRLREGRGMTTRQLSGALERAGRPVPPSGITRMEKAERVVTTDELAALAVVLGVSPSALLLPLTDDPISEVPVTGAGNVPALAAWEWSDGKGPLQFDPRRRRETQRLEFVLFGRPGWEHTGDPDEDRRRQQADWPSMRDIPEGDGFRLDYDQEGRPEMVRFSASQTRETGSDG
jgi:hypothetical protein